MEGESDYDFTQKYKRKDSNAKRSLPADEVAKNRSHKLIGEGEGRYQVEKRTKFSSDYKPEAGAFFDTLFEEPIHLEGEGNGVSIVNSFEEMNLAPSLMINIRKLGFTRPLPIQKATFSLVKEGFDIVAHAQTGAGKSAAFLIPIVHWILEYKAKHEMLVCSSVPSPYCIIMSPTRELAEQLYNSAREYTHETYCKVVVSFGDTPRAVNVTELRKGVDIHIATIGRICDYIANDVISLNRLRFFVIDEADNLLMIDHTFEEFDGVVLKKCYERKTVQSLLFSATDSYELREFTQRYMRPNVTRITVGTLNNVNRHLKQYIIETDESMKRHHLLKIMKKQYSNSNSDGTPPKTLVFVNTKRRSTVIACFLSMSGYKAYPANGNLTMSLRHEAIEALESGDAHIIVATDVLARGMDLKNISHVINYDVPPRAKWSSYVHRVGRTARLGNEGYSTTFYSPEKDSEMAIILYQWLTNNDQPVPEFLLAEALKQYGREELEDKARQEYIKAMQEAVEDSEDSDFD